MDKEHLAFIGAQARVLQLQEETRELQKFIDEYKRRAGSKISAFAVDTNDATIQNTRRIWAQGRREKKANQRRARKRTRRRTMTPEQKQAVSKRMKKYWAERRANGAK